MPHPIPPRANAPPDREFLPYRSCRPPFSSFPRKREPRTPRASAVALDPRFRGGDGNHAHAALSIFVVPAKAGTQSPKGISVGPGPRFRAGDGNPARAALSIFVIPAKAGTQSPKGISVGPGPR